MVGSYLEASAQPLAGVLISRTVLLQAMKEEPAPDAKCKDKFLVQTVAVTGDMEFSNVSSIVRLSLAASCPAILSNSYLVRESFKILHPGAQDPCELAACRVLKWRAGEGDKRNCAPPCRISIINS